jgi:hypothetical protein
MHPNYPADHIIKFSKMQHLAKVSMVTFMQVVKSNYLGKSTESRAYLFL